MMVYALVLTAAISTFDLSALAQRFDWLSMTAPEPVEVDGDFTTTEWLVSQLFGLERRVITFDAEGVVCASEPFIADGNWKLQRIGLVHKFTRFDWPIFEVMELPTPTCALQP